MQSGLGFSISPSHWVAGGTLHARSVRRRWQAKTCQGEESGNFTAGANGREWQRLCPLGVVVTLHQIEVQFWAILFPFPPLLKYPTIYLKLKPGWTSMFDKTLDTFLQLECMATKLACLTGSIHFKSYNYTSVTTKQDHLLWKLVANSHISMNLESLEISFQYDRFWRNQKQTFSFSIKGRYWNQSLLNKIFWKQDEWTSIDEVDIYENSSLKF